MKQLFNGPGSIRRVLAETVAFLVIITICAIGATF